MGYSVVDNLVATSAEKKVDKMGFSSAVLKDILLVALTVEMTDALLADWMVL